jgi:4-diphosphocytidyl-2-C-methyl-D-erythritol kinase
MGGGSGDAAAALRLAAHAAGGADPALLLRLAAALGGDVPSQVAPGRTLMTGAGEHVRPLGPPASLSLVILRSPHGLSTPAVYREFDALGVQRGPAELAQLEARGGDLPVHNDLQDAARSLCPPIDEALAAVSATGADHVLVSGSGPTVFGLYGDPERARAAAAQVGGVAAEPVDAGFGAVREA